MTRLTYYIVNHSTKEYCYGEPREPIFIALDRVLTKYNNWRRNNNICIMPEDTSSMVASEYLQYNLQYTNLDE